MTERAGSGRVGMVGPLGPQSCEQHRMHTVGCLDCAAEVCAAHDDTLDEFLDRLEHLGWERPDGW